MIWFDMIWYDVQIRFEVFQYDMIYGIWRGSMAYDIYSLLVWNNLIWHHMGIFGTWSIIWWYLKHDMIKFDVIWFGIISHSPAGMMYGPLIRWLYLIYSWGHISPIWSRSNGSRSESSRSRNEWILQTLGTNPLYIIYATVRIFYSYNLFIHWKVIDMPH